jgi:uridylate kinase
MKHYKHTYVMSLGGSLIVPSSIDSNFLAEFRKFVYDCVKKGWRLVIVTGGGATARAYRDAGNKVIKKMPVDDLDWLGIHSTRLNAHLLLTLMRDIAHPRIITNPYEPEPSKFPVIIGAGHRPGYSSDYDAVELAKQYNAELVFNLSNIDYVYDKNPKEHRNAKPIQNISWKKFRKIVGNKWDPGLNAPFDPIASKLADKYKMEVRVLNGSDFKNLKLALEGQPFKGTIIKD